MSPAEVSKSTDILADSVLLPMTARNVLCTQSKDDDVSGSRQRLHKPTQAVTRAHRAASAAARPFATFHPRCRHHLGLQETRAP